MELDFIRKLNFLAWPAAFRKIFNFFFKHVFTDIQTLLLLFKVTESGIRYSLVISNCKVQSSVISHGNPSNTQEHMHTNMNHFVKNFITKHSLPPIEKR